MNKQLESIYENILLLNDAFRNKLEKEAKELGFTKSEFIVITDLIENEPSKLMEIVKRTGIKKTTVSKIINQLIDRGIISKDACPSDGREFYLKVIDINVKEKFCKATMLEKIFPNHCENQAVENQEILESLNKLLQLIK